MCTSRLLGFKNLTEPKNDDNNNEIEYSGNYINSIWFLKIKIYFFYILCRTWEWTLSN